MDDRLRIGLDRYWTSGSFRRTDGFRTHGSDLFPLILILLVGYGLANTLFWNRTLLLSFEMADTAMLVSLIGMALKTIGTVVLVPRLPYSIEAAILSAYLAGTVGVMTWIGLSRLKSMTARSELGGSD